MIILIPDFIYSELVGPYGPDVLQKLGKIEDYYSIYNNGARFEVDTGGDYVPAKLPSKQIKKLIRREAQFLFGKSPEIKVICPEEAETKDGRPNESNMQTYLNKAFKSNLWRDKLIKGARDCLIGGRVALKVNVTDDKLSIMFVPADGFVYETALDDVDTLERIVFFYTMQDDTDRSRQRIWVQKYHKEGTRCLLDERITDGYGETIEWDGTKQDYDTGLDRIPAYVILNDGLSGDTEGVSEIRDLMCDDAWYGRLKSGNIDSLRKGMNQITYMSGVDPSCMKSFRCAPGALWDLKGDLAQASDGGAPNVQVGTISNTFSYTDAFADTESTIKQDMHDLVGVPDLNQESTRNVITSGKGLKTLYWPLICRCEEKMNAWGPALEWLAEMLLYAADVNPNLKNVYGAFEADNHVIMIDNQYPLPEDEDEEKQLDLSEVSNKTRSIKSYLTKWGGPNSKGMTPEEADAELQQIAKEQQMMQDSFAAEPSPAGDE